MPRIAIDARKIRDFGIGTYVHNLLVGLERQESDLDFVVFLPPRAALPVTSPRFRAVTVRARGYSLSEHIVLPALALRHRADLYHAPHYVLPWLTRGKAVVTIHDLIHLRFPEYLPIRAARHYAERMMRHSFTRAARVLTVSESSKRDLLEWFGGPAERVVVIANAVDEVFFAERGSAELDRARERWRLAGRFVLYAGNVKPHKNLERLIRAFAIARGHPGLADVKLVLIGNDLSRYHVLRRLAAEQRVAEHVRFLGWLPSDELASVYRLAAVFAYPSLYEGFGLPPLEAMASGVAVVAANTASLPEVCGDAALLVSPTDVEAIAAALVALLDDAGLAKEMSGRGHKRALEFRRRDPAAAVAAVYRQVLGAGQVPGTGAGAAP